MLRELRIKNFRGLANVEVRGLQRINLIGGTNDVGKTTLLEAVFVLSGPANVAVPFLLSAGRQQPQALPADAVRWMFGSGDLRNPIEIASGAAESLEIRVESTAQAELSLPPPRQDANGSSGEPLTAGVFSSAQALQRLVLDYQRANSHYRSTLAFGVGIGQPIINQAQLPQRPPLTIFNTARGAMTPEDLEAFSRLDESGELEGFVRSLRIIEPRLKRVAMLVRNGSPEINADIGTGLLPLALAGDGLTRMFTFLLAIARAAGGLVLIDEIENGIHYSAQRAIWAALLAAARAYDVQLFATTHSWECVAAAHEVFANEPSEEFAYHRLQAVGGGVEAVTLDRAALQIAFDQGREIR